MYVRLLAAPLCLLVGCYVFLLGFFPPHTNHSSGAHEDSGFEKGSAAISGGDGEAPRLVFVVIDGLRWDWAERLPFLSSLAARGEARQFTAATHTPTVTLPRLKSIVSGVVAEYLDIMDNYDAAAAGGAGNAALAGSWPVMAAASGLRLVFYGDDTWLKMFAGHESVFVRARGVSSFFVHDFSEVDDSVTAGLLSELSRADWHVLVLHYLGVDHIGHSRHAASALITAQLRQFDTLLQRAYEQLNRRGEWPPPMLVVCGDHGMADGGGHGGASYAETHVPLGFYSRLYLNTSTSGSAHSSGGIVRQEDIASTLAALLSLPPPPLSVGRVLPDVVRPLDTLRRRYNLASLVINADQLLRLCRRRLPSSSVVSEVERILSQLTVTDSLAAQLSFSTVANQTTARNDDDAANERVLTAAIMRMQAALTRQDRHHDPVSMATGALVVLLTIVYVATLHCDNGGASSMRRNCMLCAAAVTVGLMLLCGALTASSVACRLCARQNWRPTASLIVALSFLLAQLSQTRFRCHVKFKSVLREDLVTSCLAAGIVLQLLSLFSSSLIEEEHQSWHQLITVLWMLLLLLDTARRQHHKHSQDRRTCAIFAALLVSCACLRRWNRCGDKWRHLPTARDIVASQPWMSALAPPISLLLLAGESVSRGGGVATSTAAAIMLLLVASSWWWRVVALLVAAWQAVTARSPSLFWLWLGGVLCRRDNLPAWSALLMQMQLVSRWFTSSSTRRPSMPPRTTRQDKTLPDNRPLKVALVFHCVGAAGFFYMGNSNSPATVDISAGYALWPHAWWPVAVLLTMCHVLLAPVAAILYALETAEQLQCWQDTLRYFLLIRSCSVLVNFLVASCFVRHLFVWSVFTPKLLYECVAAAMVSFVCIFALTLRRLMFSARLNYPPAKLLP